MSRLPIKLRQGPRDSELAPLSPHSPYVTPFTHWWKDKQDAKEHGTLGQEDSL